MTTTVTPSVVGPSPNTQVEHPISTLCENEAIAFVDGSYDVTGKRLAFGAIIFS